MSKERLEKIMQAYDKWIATEEEEEFQDDCSDPIVGIGFIGGWNTRDKEVKAEEKEKTEAVKELVMYLFDDELRDYSENPSDNHIFLKLMKLKEMFGIEIENMCMNGLIYLPKPEEQMDFEKELEVLINKHSKENESDTPDFILAQYLKGCLANYAETVKARDKWYGFKGLSEHLSDI